MPDSHHVNIPTYLCKDMLRVINTVVRVYKELEVNASRF